MNTLDVACKEWAVVCQALAEGRQSVLLRKGGIAEAGGQFRPQHEAFLLYPTYFHEQRAGIIPEWHERLAAVEAERPPAGIIRLTHWVRVLRVEYVQDLAAALALRPQHIWTDEVVRQRFHYREPGLFVLHVETYPLPQAVERLERPEYAGCKSWVHLDQPVPLAAAPLEPSS
ncbi:MAG: DUF1802 family protein [Thermogemmata sp.]|uniref:DUF1802 family protein n=1 Tax=Thermogemmata fonticola TaxID=2755323 RepID=A0A7V8VGQ7_9BACT|nr:DUF1802 family protein [Thermogemmata fonticola]MBA2227621.1 DUF1802 family protein [Thermogemmata fonticola]MCX8139714.1 DUF1802 family protein [Gemmataceae bacterium]GIW85328.1 MAG: hypothetical protein KatS3mg107_0988 [Gemmataceae bacterium]